MSDVYTSLYSFRYCDIRQVCKTFKYGNMRTTDSVVYKRHQLGCIITLKPFDDHHNHREDHENTRNVVFIELQEKECAYL